MHVNCIANRLIACICSLLVRVAMISTLAISFEGWIYWAEVGMDTITRAHLDGTGAQTLGSATQDLANPAGLALDVNDDEMYWTAEGIDLTDETQNMRWLACIGDQSSQLASLSNYSVTAVARQVFGTGQTITFGATQARTVAAAGDLLNRLIGLASNPLCMAVFALSCIAVAAVGTLIVLVARRNRERDDPIANATHTRCGVRRRKKAA